MGNTGLPAQTEPKKRNAPKRIELTQAKVDRLPAPDPSGDQVTWWDTKSAHGLRGFGVRCSGTTGHKAYVVMHSVRDPSKKAGYKQVTIVLGEAAGENRITLDQARTKASTEKATLKQKGDTRPKRDETVTLREALDQYLADRELKPRTRASYEFYLGVPSTKPAVAHKPRREDKYLHDWLDRRLSAISQQEVLDRFRTIKAESGAATAKLVFSAYSAVWAHAKACEKVSTPRIENRRLVGDNPVTTIKEMGLWGRLKKRDGRIPLNRLPSFYRAARELKSELGRDFILMALFSGFRKEELLKLQWSEVDLVNGIITLPGFRVKNSRSFPVPITAPLKEILMRRRAAQQKEKDSSPYVFPSAQKVRKGRPQATHIKNPQDWLDEIEAATGIESGMHDLRHNYASVARLLLAEWDVALLLNHNSGSSVTAGYAHVSAEHLRSLANRVADAITEKCKKVTPRPMHKRKAA